jgi:hypothetical protein
VYFGNDGYEKEYKKEVQVCEEDDEPKVGKMQAWLFYGGI